MGLGYVLPGVDVVKVAGKLGEIVIRKRGVCNRCSYCRCRNIRKSICESYPNDRRPFKTNWNRNAATAVSLLVHGLGNAIKSLRKTKGNTSNFADDVIQQKRRQRELTNQVMEEQALQDTRFKNEPESLLVKAAPETAPSLENAIDSVVKQEKKPSPNGELPDDVQAMRNAPPVIQTAMAPDGRTIIQKKLMDSFRDNLGITLRTGRVEVRDDAVLGGFL